MPMKKIPEIKIAKTMRDPKTGKRHRYYLRNAGASGAAWSRGTRHSRRIITSGIFGQGIKALVIKKKGANKASERTNKTPERGVYNIRTASKERLTVKTFKEKRGITAKSSLGNSFRFTAPSVSTAKNAYRGVINTVIKKLEEFGKAPLKNENKPKKSPPEKFPLNEFSPAEFYSLAGLTPKQAVNAEIGRLLSLGEMPASALKENPYRDRASRAINENKIPNSLVEIALQNLVNWGIVK
ncbi:MAG: hypothetical protein V1494_04335 [Candidatus Diapherotrites archaeon]